MEKSKTSKKALKGLINDSMQEALKNLELPEQGKKVKKVLLRNSKKLASIFSAAIKDEDRKKRKAAKFMEDAVNGKGKKKSKKIQQVTLKQNEVLAAV